MPAEYTNRIDIAQALSRRSEVACEWSGVFMYCTDFLSLVVEAFRFLGRVDFKITAAGGTASFFFRVAENVTSGPCISSPLVRTPPKGKLARVLVSDC